MNKYIVIEIQTMADGTVANVTTAYDSQNAAESAYHTILAAAAVSELPCHAAIVVSSEGFPLMHQCYKH